MTPKKPKPELLSTFDGSIILEEMAMDKTGNRILATDSNGSLYSIDLATEAPSPEYLVGGLGTITDVDLSADGTSLLLLDTAAKRVLKIECPHEAGECTTPEVFAAIPEFKQPLSITRDMNGTVWVGDLGAQSIFGFDSEGTVVRTVRSISGIGD